MKGLVLAALMFGQQPADDHARISPASPSSTPLGELESRIEVFEDGKVSRRSFLASVSVYAGNTALVNYSTIGQGTDRAPQEPVRPAPYSPGEVIDPRSRREGKDEWDHPADAWEPDHRYKKGHSSRYSNRGFRKIRGRKVC